MKNRWCHFTPFLQRDAILCFLAIAFAAFEIDAYADTVKIAVRAHSGAQQAIKNWGPTADYLSEKIPEHKFTIVPAVTFDDMESIVTSGQADFVLTNPSNYAEMESLYKITRIATLINFDLGKPLTTFGSVIITSSNRADINGLNDLKGKTFATVEPNAFGSWLVPIREFNKRGIDAPGIFAKVVYSGTHEGVVRDVLSGKADAGAVRTGIMERMVLNGDLDMKQIKPINLKSNPDFPFMLSTDVYPEWAFARTRKISFDLAEQVTIALLSLPHENSAANAGKYFGWTAPLDYSSVHDVMKELRVSIYKDYGDVELEDVLRNYAYWIISIVLLMLWLAVAVVKLAATRRKLRKELLHSAGMARTISESEERFRKVFSEGQLGMSIVGLDYRFVKVNDALAKMTGYTEEELMGLSFPEITHPDDLTLDVSQAQRLLHGEIPGYTIEKRYIKKTGEIIWVNLSGSIIRGEAGEPLYFIAQIEDITRARSAREMAAEKMRFLSQMMDTIPFPVFYKDTSLREHAWLKERAIGKSVHEVFSGEYADILENADKIALESMSELQKEITYKTPEGQRKAELLVRNIFHNQDGSVGGLVGVTIDITSRKEMEEALVRAKESAEAANKLKDKFVSIVAHDLKSPLVGIVGLLEYTLRDNTLQDKHSGILTTVTQSAKQLGSVIEEMLNISRLQTGQMKRDFHEIALCEVAAICASKISGAAERKNIRIINEVPPDVKVTTDPTLLEMALSNLISNAVKFSYAGKNIRVFLANGDKLSIGVEDKGVGIAETVIPKLFKYEEKTTSRGTAGEMGTGFGLPLCADIMKTLGGSIRLATEQGKGSVFYLELPNAMPAGGAPNPANISTSQA